MKYDFQKRSDDSAIYFDVKSSLTKQEFVSGCNINNIIKKYTKNGINPLCITQDAKYGDFTDVPSHQEALDLIMAADEHFMQLPAELRARFANDPGQLLEFLGDPSNREEAVKLGLVQDLNNDVLKNSPPKADVKGSEGASES